MLLSNERNKELHKNESIVTKEIENIKLKDVKEGYKVPEELRYLKPKNVLGKRKAKNIYKMPFADVENMRRRFNTPEGLIDAMCVLFDCPEDLMLDYRIIQFHHAANYLISQIKRINDVERATLSKPPKQDDVELGIRELDRFGALNILDRLGQEFGKSPEEVEQWPYGLIYSLMWKRRIESDIEDARAEKLKNK